MQFAYYLHTDFSGGRAWISRRRVSVATVVSRPSSSTQPFFAQPSWVNYETKVEIMDNFSKQFGRHSFKVGVDYAGCRSSTPI